MQYKARWIGITLLMILLTPFGCAQDVDDIDRTQTNLLKKSDFEGVWYFRQTITEVPAQVDYAFVGYSSKLEKVSWEIREDLLIAYRAYEIEPGTDPDAGVFQQGQTQFVDGMSDKGFSPDTFAEQPVAAFPIKGHADVQREYNPSTGEQSNVIVENTSDREWHEREYLRVDWSSNMVQNIDFFTSMNSIADTSYFVDKVEGGPDAFYDERRTVVRDGVESEELGYFDFVNKLALSPDRYDCYFYNLNCIPGEIKVRNSFSRLEEMERDYEPAFFDDQHMNKFGFFRTERLVYDRREGFTDTKRLTYATRHDLWEADFRRDESGEYLRDEDGKRVPIPMGERTPKPVVYYLSPNFPEPVLEAAYRIADDWDRSFSRAVAAAKDMSIDEVNDEYGPMFVLCEIPVQSADAHPACDPRRLDKRLNSDGEYEPFVPRLGDLRYSVLWWVDEPQAAGPLGYGPPFDDPETGEIISGTAYVYGASVDTYAQSGVDIVKLANGDFSESQLREGADITQYLNETLRQDLDPRASVAPDQLLKLDSIGVEDHLDLLDDRKRAVFELIRDHGAREVLDDDVLKHRAILDRFKAHGWDKKLVDSEILPVLTAGEVGDLAQMSDAELNELMERRSPMHLREVLKKRQEFRHNAGRKTIYFAEFDDPAVVGVARSFEGRDDYEAIWNEIRANIFYGVGAHEVGHSVGLRHNFQGSYDTLNYFDEYWDLKGESLTGQPIASIADLYVLSEMTEGQLEGDMRAYQYSSIMDYHSRFNGDWQGLGRYDDAAILFGYTFGTYEEEAEQASGFVEVFADLPPAAQDLMLSFDGRKSPADRQLLENWHYATVLSRMGNDPSVLQNRDLVPWDEHSQRIAEGDPTRPAEVPYMFCSDEIAGALISCQRWDLGADPLEIVQSARDNYFAYYPLTHFRRERRHFDPIGPLNRSFRTNRTFLTVYQQWLLGNQDVEDDILNTYYILAAGLGFNVLTQMMSLPRYGSYTEDGPSGELVWDDYEMGDGPNIPMGVGRRTRSLYDSNSGYFYFERMQESGHFWDWLGALFVAIEPVARTVAVDTAADREAFLVPFYLLFEDELTRLFNGQISDELEDITPRLLSSGEVRQRPNFVLNSGTFEFDPATGEPVSSFNEGTPVRVEANLTQERYAALYGVAFFNELYTNHYVDQARVFKLGHGDQLEVEAGSGFEVMTFTDPTTGLAYGAVAESSPESGDRPLAVTLVERGQAAQAALEADPGNAQLEFEIQRVVDSINLLTDIVRVYGGTE